MANTKVTGDLIASLTIATGNIANNAITSDKISGLTTAHITEGANLYYTDARARAAVSVSGNALSYNSSTGVITSNFEESPTFTGNVVLNGDGNALKWTPTSYDDWTMTTDSNGLVIYNITDARYDLKISGDGNSTFAGNVGIGVAAHGTASLNITNTDQHIRLNNGSELGVISLDTDGKLDFWAHGTDETINFRTGTGSGTVTMSVVGEKVGIGTTSPSANLHVSSSSLAVLKVGTTGVADALVDIRGYDAGVHIGDATNGLRWAIWNDGPSTSSSLKFGSYALGTWYGDAAQVVTMTSDGKVGIGTTSPSTLLHLNKPTALTATYQKFTNGTATTGTTLGIDADGDFLINNGEAKEIKLYTNDTQRLTIQSGGNVGIGTSSPAAKLHVEGTIKLGGYSYIGEDLSDQDSLTIASDHTEAIHFAHFTPATSTYSTNMIIDQYGNVGIGTSSPNKRLTIGGVNTTEGVNLYTKVGSTLYKLWEAEQYFSDEGYQGMYYSNVKKIQFRANGDSYFNSGNVGIGTTSPSYKLTVADSTANGRAIQAVQSATSGTNYGFQGGAYGVGATKNIGLSITAEGATTNDAAHFMGGNVGIGTTSPSRELDIQASSGWAEIALRGTSGAGGSLEFWTTTTKRAEIFADTEDIVFRNTASNTERMRITSGGNVAIGTTSSAERVTIAGIGSLYPNIKFTFPGITSRFMKIGMVNATKYEFHVNGSGTYMTFATEGTEKMRVTASGKTLIGTTSEQNAGTLQVQSGGSENGGTLDIAAGGHYRYYTRVCRNATSVGAAGYWHIKTNIPANSNTMFLAKFYGYIYGSAQILDLQHCGYAYSGSGTVINQGATNNGTDPNASSAVYISANGSKVTFRIAFGSGSNFSTYFAGVFMDMAFPSPAGQGHDFEIEAQSFSTSTTVY